MKVRGQYEQLLTVQKRKKLKEKFLLEITLIKNLIYNTKEIEMEKIASKSLELLIISLRVRHSREIAASQVSIIT